MKYRLAFKIQVKIDEGKDYRMTTKKRSVQRCCRAWNREIRKQYFKDHEGTI